MTETIEKLGIEDAGDAATVTLHNYVCDRSVAIVAYTDPNTPSRIGSGACVRIGDRIFIATARHVVDGYALDQLRVAPSGFAPAPNLVLVGGQASKTADVAFLEVDAETVPQGLKGWTSDQLEYWEPEASSPCLVQGYPGNEVEQDGADLDLLASGVLTLTLPPGDGAKLLAQYPPHDGSLDDKGLLPHGVSGGAFVKFQSFEDDVIWAVENSTLVGLNRAWDQETRTLKVEPISKWIEFVQTALPELAAAIPTS